LRGAPPVDCRQQLSNGGTIYAYDVQLSHASM
jgi:hypothetical protein